MATVLLCNRISGSGKRVKIDGVNLKSSVVLLRNQVSTLIDAPESTIELIYCGRILRDVHDLEHYGVKPGVTLHALPKTQEQPTAKPEVFSGSKAKELVISLQQELINPAYRSTVEKLFRDRDALYNFLSSCPGLEQDPAAQAALQESDLLTVMSDPKHIQGVLEAHPALGPALTAIVEYVRKNASKAGSRSRNARGAYSLDAMSDDEDEDEEMASGSGGGQTVTANQLAAALMAVQNAGLGGSGSGGGAGSSNSSNGAESGGISSSLFQAAMQQAANGAGAGPSQVTEEQMQSQLGQLRDMGITDEAVARQALTATGGNLQAALEMLFGDMQ